MFHSNTISAQDSISSKKSRVHFSGIALPSRTPENGFYVQGGIVAVYKTRRSDTTLRASNTYLYGLYSQLQQWRISLGGDIFTPGEKYYIDFWYYSSYVPEKYFGLGNETNPQVSEFISSSVWYANTIVLRKLRKNNFLGLVHTLANSSPIDYPVQGIFDDQKPNGYAGYFVNGLGILFRHDSRDFLLSSQKGFFLEGSASQFSPFLGSEFSFLSYKLDVRKFFCVLPKKGHVLAFQALHQGVNGEVPWLFIPSIDTRAYHPNLYRGNLVFWLQAEYKMRVWKRLGASFFGGVAQLDDQYAQLWESPIRPNYGMGLRFKLVPKYNMNLRVEYGIGQNSSNFYIAFYDAF
jgi:hypothetical protein